MGPPGRFRGRRASRLSHRAALKPARKYLDRLADVSGIPVRWVSIGPDRDRTLELPA